MISSEKANSGLNTGNLGSVPVLSRSSGEGNGNPFQYSCLENPMDRELCIFNESDTTEQLTQFTTTVNLPKGQYCVNFIYHPNSKMINDGI